MKSKLYFLAVVIGTTTLGSCQKFNPIDTGNKPIKQHNKVDTDVYAAGYTYASNNVIQVAAYWKNGVLHKISDTTARAYLSAIAAHDTDVVMAGTQQHPDFSQTAFYYRNGQKVVLSDNASIDGSQSIAFSKCGCDVYICGTASVNGLYKAVYWINGVQHWLPANSPNTYAFSIAVHGSDVYVAGMGVTTQRTTYAMYWKNGIAFALTDTLANSQAIGMNVNDSGDVYIAGYTMPANILHATYWKNGIAYPLDNNRGGEVISIVTVGKDFYATGGLYNPVETGYWKNNVFTNLSTSPYEASTHGITVLGNDVYVSGATLVSPKTLPGYWKNGTFVALPGNQGYASSIALVTRPH